eukprot:2712211-Prymnesium_polylepis.1
MNRAARRRVAVRGARARTVARVGDEAEEGEQPERALPTPRARALVRGDERHAEAAQHFAHLRALGAQPAEHRHAVQRARAAAHALPAAQLAREREELR